MQVVPENWEISCILYIPENLHASAIIDSVLACIEGQFGNEESGFQNGKYSQ